jgi:hypothetical protein
MRAEKRPSGDSNMNFASPFVFDLNFERKRRETRLLRPPRIGQLLDQAVEFQRLLDSRAVRFRADLARRSGLSAMRVTQILALLKLAPSVVAWIRSLPPGTPDRMVTERALRALTALPPRKQVEAALRLNPIFRGFLPAEEAC